MPDFTYAAVKASGRKGKLLTDQQIMELATQKDLKDIVNRIKPNYPSLANASPDLVEYESILKESFFKEVDEFIKVSPETADFFMIIKREAQEDEAVELMKWHLGILTEAQLKPPLKKLGRQDVIEKLKRIGYEEEVEWAAKLYAKHPIPALLESVFVRGRLLKLSAMVGKMKGQGEPLLGYIRLKADLYNVITILRGLKNGIDPKAIEEVLIFDEGTLRKAELKETLKAGTQAKALAYLESRGAPKAETPRELEREYEKKIVANLERAYYKGYGEIGAILGYLELKLNEISNLVRVANAVVRGVDPKSLSQSYLT